MTTEASVATCVALLKKFAPSTYESLARTPLGLGGGLDHGHGHDGGGDGDHDGHDHDHGGHGHSHGLCEGLEGIYSVGLHVLAIFVVLIASVLGAVLPILGKRVRALRVAAYVYAVGKCVATGVMLAVAMIHMINHAAEAFGEDCVPASFAESFEGWAFLFALVAAIVMHGVDVIVVGIAEEWADRRDAAATEPCSGGDADAGVLACADDKCGNVFQGPTDGAVTVPVALDDKEGRMCSHGQEGCAGHQHGVAVPDDMPRLQRVVSAVCMEFGVTLHSVFVGLALGVTSNDDLKVLLVALVFHQMFEGLAMGARLAEAGFRMSLEIVLMLVFALSAPVGIAAGTIAVSVSKEALSGATYVMVSAVLDSVCGGILLYLAFGLLFIDFPAEMRAHCGRDAPHRVWKKVGLLAGLWVGVCVMAVIGKWL